MTVLLLLLFIRTVFIAVFLGFSCRAQNFTCSTEDSTSLEAFARHLDSGRVDGWGGGSDCCQWVGVTCSNSGRVIELDLARRRLAGNISDSLGNLGELKTLNLSHNFLRGAIPNSLLHLPLLETFDLSNNDVSGQFDNTTTAAANLPSIRAFNISDNSITGAAPVWICKNSTVIKVINFADNLFSGILPLGIGDCASSLEELDLSANFIHGGFPEDLFHLRNLKKMSLQDNQFSGHLSGHLIGNLSNLTHIDLSLNELSGNLPDIFDRFPHLRFFSAQSNRFVGKIPTTLANSPTLVSLSLRNNSLSGTIDLNCSAMVNLVSLNLATNDFRGEIPKNLPECSRLRTINFARINFSGIIGCGGFGLVYKAVLSDGRKLAIKRLSGEHFQIEREFRAEIETLSRAQHPNLVRLQGYCKYKKDRLLLYTYMENGSLDYWLHEKVDGPTSLDWETRLNIAKGAARGLAYLHQSCEPHILHRDIKSSNILLNEKFEAHLADFGLARLILPYDTHVSTDLVGTLGYIPPEYGQASVATYKGDVYSFGVVLLELLTGKRPMDLCRKRENRDLIAWVREMRREERETEVFDPFLYEKRNAEEMVSVLEIACVCLSENPKMRPFTQELVSWLDKVGSVPEDELS
ncbi:PREDICTED: phytosulfokine receptor 1-like [Erythranthe guttata]|uniref:phytosulfokine receptor 1-like n=1 Tax=Erythranthe guttata TaxID=4155 RepID=UPI00064E0179|nr:PREDICTED: phytosulfokine receptor 1-like [Erythranthe guttata]|eukprot:XP_012839587.1 PREDICTED: phytosulfokine receptor 1-like [Erythranthe guttata]